MTRRPPWWPSEEQRQRAATQGYTAEENEGVARLSRWVTWCHEVGQYPSARIVRPVTGRRPFTGTISVQRTHDPDGSTRTIVQVRDSRRAGGRQYRTVHSIEDVEVRQPAAGRYSPALAAVTAWESLVRGTPTPSYCSECFHETHTPQCSRYEPMLREGDTLVIDAVIGAVIGERDGQPFHEVTGWRVVEGHEQLHRDDTLTPAEHGQIVEDEDRAREAQGWEAERRSVEAEAIVEGQRVVPRLDDPSTYPGRSGMDPATPAMPDADPPLTPAELAAARASISRATVGPAGGPNYVRGVQTAHASVEATRALLAQLEDDRLSAIVAAYRIGGCSIRELVEGAGVEPHLLYALLTEQPTADDVRIAVEHEYPEVWS